MAKKAKTTGKKPEGEFEDIAERAIEEAEGVECSLEVFVVGLRDIETAIRHRREISEAELEGDNNK